MYTRKTSSLDRNANAWLFSPEKRSEEGYRFWRIKLFPHFIASLKHIKMFWILNSHQALATRSCALTWAPWCKLPYAVPEFYYSSLIPLLVFSRVPPFFPWSSLFFLCELFLQTVQCFSCCLLMRCQLDHFRQNHFVVIILVMSHFFIIFWPLDRFLSFGTLLYYQAPFFYLTCDQLIA